ncbi:MAG: 16S rRNA (guanine(527)-N(7))-methyltransferase RsmG [Planctomycetales bacterium]|nr:16S rRNA (guanine(527)-N(7))-methyltransferase RsmG [Planctomycetales bacterium]
MTTPPLHLEPARLALHEHQAQFERFSEMLIEANKTHNLTRITDPSQIRTRHFLDSLAALSLLDDLEQKTQKPLRLLDIGAGAGLPGLALAIVRPQWSIVSLEATEKKVRFQQTACKALALTNVQALSGRAEDLAHDARYRRLFDAVTARALAAMPMLAELSLAFVRIGGIGLYWKGPAVTDELAEAAPAIQQMGAAIEQVAPYTLDISHNQPAHLTMVVCRKTRLTPDTLPRVFGLIKKQPLSNK